MNSKTELLATVEKLALELPRTVDFSYIKPLPRKPSYWKIRAHGPWEPRYWPKVERAELMHMRSLPRITISVGRTTYRVIADGRTMDAFAKRIKKTPKEAFQP